MTTYNRAAAYGPVLLGGVVGSTAYGLNTATSDIDRLGIFAASTLDLCGLDPVTETHVYTEPDDATFHEAGKFARLALSCNPTVLELLWLNHYDIVTDAGTDLLAIRDAFLSGPRVKAAYLGYARSQLHRLQHRGDGTFSSDTRNRTAKHARHMARLVNQGLTLYTEGHLDVHVTDPEWYHQFSEEPPEVWETWFEQALHQFDNATTCLPDRPRRASVARWLRQVRATQFR